MEIWKDIQGYEGFYQVSNLGNVKSVERMVYRTDMNNYKKVCERTLKLSIVKNGYCHAVLCKGHRLKTFRVHRLVAGAFIPNPDNYRVVNHINGIKTDNRVVNLEWCTDQMNVRHAQDIGLKPKSSTPKRIPKRSNARSVRLTPEMVRRIREDAKTKSITHIAKEMGYTVPNIWAIVNFKTWKKVV